MSAAKKSKGNTKPRQFRLDDDVLAQLDAIVELLGIGTRVAVLRLLIRQEHNRQFRGKLVASRHRPPKGAAK